MLKTENSIINLPKLEEDIINFWKKNRIFEKSLEKDSPKGDWTFLDGPPFITGLPHYGNLLSSMPKDVFPRYKTMNGYRVRRVYGWDCHGLPAENKVENKLGIKKKKDIEEKVGVAKFIAECKSYVSEVSGEWEWYIDHVARWVDFKNAYKTMDVNYMESVMWVFKQIYDKGYIYKGLRVSLYCPHCSTPISNFEVAMDTDNYKEITEKGTIYKYKVEGDKDAYFLAWSTTPWNKLATPAIAVNPKLKYVKVNQDGENYILSETALGALGDKEYKIIEEFSGTDLIGKKFAPHFDFYKDNIKDGEKAFVVIGSDFVTADEGTGIVTIAAYGEEDLDLMKKENIHIVLHVDDEGVIKDHVPDFGGMNYLNANEAVNKNLFDRKLVYKDENYTHTVPTCWRCHTRLYYSPQDAWYVDVQKLKPLLKKTNESINWFPSHFKYGRFLKSMEAAPDWCVSRSRYWGSPVPVWECECGERFVPGSIDELEKMSGRKIKDLHKPEIDEVIVRCKACGKKVKRVPEVLDSWIEAGSASFAERHFPFKKGVKLEDFFPPDFIVEYTGQIRAWFYVLHVISTAIYKTNAFKNVLVTGVILGTDGRKMSKNYGNYPDPKEMIQKYGGDALRLYLLGASVMIGEDISISEEQYRQQVRGTLLILCNVYNFFAINSQLDKWKHKDNHNAFKSHNVLDQWILSLLQTLNKDVSSSLDNYDTITAVDKIKIFINEFSTWYIRRSRTRVGAISKNINDKEAFYLTTYKVLTTLCKLMAPLTPFISEAIYRDLTGEESVHITDWPGVEKSLIDLNIEKQMSSGRDLVEIGLALRKKNNLKLRQPLGTALYTSPNQTRLDNDISNLVLEELNVKSWFQGSKISLFTKKPGVVSEKQNNFILYIDTNLTKALEEEGEAREIIRNIQKERKNIGTKLDEKVYIIIPSWPKSFEGLIKSKALVKSIKKGAIFSVERI